MIRSSEYDKLELKHQNLDYKMHYSKNMSRCETKICALVKQNIMKFEVFILGGKRNDQKRKRDGGGWSRERIEKGSREGIKIERKGN